MRATLQKMQGCGNNFLFIDSMNSTPIDLLGGEIRFLCDMNFGVGADGVVVLMQPTSEEADAKWMFYNSDGSEAEMCGNAARCAIRYLYDNYFSDGGVISLEAKVGVLSGQVLDENLVEITLLPDRDLEIQYEQRVVHVDERYFEVNCINTGVPHAVMEVKNLDTYPINKVGALIQKHPMFQPAETNVTFFQRGVGSEIKATTYERGVEDQTMACGTGAAAAALVYSELYLQDLPIQVQMPGGLLTVDMSPASRMLLLQGPAEYVYKMEIDSVPKEFHPPKFFGSGKDGDL